MDFFVGSNEGRVGCDSEMLGGMGVPLMGPPPPEVAHRFRVTYTCPRSHGW